MRIVNIMLSPSFGGLEQVYLDYSECLLSRGHQVLAICQRNSPAEERIRALDTGDMEICLVGAKGGVGAALTMLRIQAVCRRFRPDVIIIHNYIHMCWWATRWLGVPVVSVSHMFKIKHVPKLDGYIALNSQIEQACAEATQGSVRLYRIPNMVKGAFKTPEVSFRQPPVIGGLGRLASEKGFHLLFEACHLLKLRGLAFRCVIGGDGYHLPFLQERVAALDLHDEVRFAGLIEDKERFFDGIDLYVMSSTSETFGLTLLEAMQSGTPVITCDLVGPREVVGSEANGFIVPTGDPIALADALERALKDPELCEAKANSACVMAEQEYSAERVGEKLEAALADVAGCHV